ASSRSTRSTRASAGWRSCSATMPPAIELREEQACQQADREAEQDRPDQGDVRRGEHEVHGDGLPVLDYEGDEIGDGQGERDEDEPELRLPRLVDLLAAELEEPAARKGPHFPAVSFLLKLDENYCTF